MARNVQAWPGWCDRWKTSPAIDFDEMAEEAIEIIWLNRTLVFASLCARIPAGGVQQRRHPALT